MTLFFLLGLLLPTCMFYKNMRSLVLRPVPLCFMDTYFWDSVYRGNQESPMQGACSSGNRSNQPRHRICSNAYVFILKESCLESVRHRIEVPILVKSWKGYGKSPGIHGERDLRNHRIKKKSWKNSFAD